jgi:hypothetical protein
MVGYRRNSAMLAAGRATERSRELDRELERLRLFLGP